MIEPGSPIWRVLGALQDAPKKSRGGYSTRCPAHEDQHASLSIGTGLDGRVLLKCHAGCPPENILAALNLSLSDLFEKSAAGNPVRRFHLIDQSGQTIAIHVREDVPGDKKIWWESHGKTGLNGTPLESLPLYRLPDLLAADPAALVVVCEGEKAADALADLGILAVGTVTGASGTPCSTSLAPLEGHEVALWPDNDTPGHEHMQKVAKRLRSPPQWVDWKDAPPKGDAADYVANGGTADGVLAMLSSPASPALEGPRIWTGPQLAAMAFDVQRWAIPELLPAGLTILAGRPKLGKSWLALGWALDIPRPSPALRKLKVVQGETLYLALEDGPRRMQERMALMLGDAAPPAGFHVVTEWPRTNEGGIDLLEQWLTAHPQARMVVVDTFKRVRPIEKSSQRLYDLDYDAIAPLAELARRSNVAIVLVFHTRKMQSDDPLEMVSGTLGVSGAADAVIVLRRERGQADASLFVTGRDVEEQDLALRWEKDDLLAWTLLGNAEDFRRSAERQAILDVIHMAPGIVPREIADALDKPAGNVRKLLFGMVREGEVRTRDGRYFPIGNGGNGGNGLAGLGKEPGKASVSGNAGNAVPRAHAREGNGNAGNAQSQSVTATLPLRTEAVTAPVTSVTSVTAVTPVTNVTDSVQGKAAGLCRTCGTDLLSWQTKYGYCYACTPRPYKEND